MSNKKQTLCLMYDNREQMVVLRQLRHLDVAEN